MSATGDALAPGPLVGSRSTTAVCSIRSWTTTLPSEPASTGMRPQAMDLPTKRLGGAARLTGVPRLRPPSGSCAGAAGPQTGRNQSGPLAGRRQERHSGQKRVAAQRTSWRRRNQAARIRPTPIPTATNFSGCRSSARAGSNRSGIQPGHWPGSARARAGA